MLDCPEKYKTLFYCVFFFAWSVQRKYIAGCIFNPEMYQTKITLGELKHIMHHTIPTYTRCILFMINTNTKYIA